MRRRLPVREGQGMLASTFRHTATAAGLCLLALTAPAAAQSPPSTDARPKGPWQSSHAGWTVWSHKVDKRYVLLARRGNATRRLPAPASRITHDPGAGPGPTGRPSAVYQRCTGSVCSIWRIDLATARQQRIENLGRIRRETGAINELSAETHPRLWGARVAFKTRHPAGEDELPLVRVGSATGRGDVRTVRVRIREGIELAEMALGSDHVATYWADDTCFGRCEEMFLNGIASGRQRVLDELDGTDTCASIAERLRYDGRGFRWTRVWIGNTNGDECGRADQRLRYDPRTNRVTGSGRR